MHLNLEVQFDSTKLTKLNIDLLRDLLREHGYEVLAAAKHRFKPGADYVLVVEGKTGREALIREMTTIHATKLHGISDWHVD
jgi:hypothetical protein